MSQPSDNVSRRRELRQTSTKAERLLWFALRNRNIAGLKFRRQVSVGPWIVDFLCVEENLVIELDGGYHDLIQDKDQQREQQLIKAGYRVVRFANEEVIENLEGVTIAIKRFLGLPDEEAPSP
ncbi:endonuclease domain-containing protein [Blastopirellula marina]|uniref:DUF559 domain-containing protein n=1 Tax=Blastopirellula marina TaxID=124 RepID=A0A2S8G0K9_9BACT|nr:endonuclease domain-containing protein [Blastopirellula marina]PQO37977.1 hypothetical protein C5Y98_07760 [Blastopirellula marina]PTL44633.1 endonuclease domain-containing protein [Blastopirellula marina]